MPYEIKLEKITVQPIAAARYQVAPADISSAMGEAFQRVFAHVGRVGGIPAGPPLAAYHSFDEQSIDVEIGVPIVTPIQEDPSSSESDLPPVRNSELPGGLVATTTHVGPYDGLEAAWTAVMGWIEDHGHEPADLVCWECYLTDPAAEPDPSRWRTDLYVPLKS